MEPKKMVDGAGDVALFSRVYALIAFFKTHARSFQFDIGSAGSPAPTDDSVWNGPSPEPFPPFAPGPSQPCGFDGIGQLGTASNGYCLAFLEVAPAHGANDSWARGSGSCKTMDNTVMTIESSPVFQYTSSVKGPVFDSYKYVLTAQPTSGDVRPNDHG
jgi:hypothetical protein